MSKQALIFTAIATLVGAGVVVALPIGATPDDGARQGDRLVFNMNAQHVGTGGGGMTPLTIVVNRWNTPDERDALEEIFLDRGMQALADALRSATEVGFIRAPSMSSTGWRLRYAQMYRGAEEGTRIIHIATDRPIDFEEAFEGRGQWTWNHNVTFIEMTLDDEGKGEGVLAVGVEFRYDEENDTLQMASVSSQPIRLNQIVMQVEGGQ